MSGYQGQNHFAGSAPLVPCNHYPLVNLSFCARFVFIVPLQLFFQIVHSEPGHKSYRSLSFSQ